MVLESAVAADDSRVAISSHLGTVLSGGDEAAVPGDRKSTDVLGPSLGDLALEDCTALSHNGGNSLPLQFELAVQETLCGPAPRSSADSGIRFGVARLGGVSLRLRNGTLRARSAATEPPRLLPALGGMNLRAALIPSPTNVRLRAAWRRMRDG
jgi:hypothetical protein